MTVEMSGENKAVLELSSGLRLSLSATFATAGSLDACIHENRNEPTQ